MNTRRNSNADAGESSFIHPSAVLADTAVIEPLSIIASNVAIGARTRISAGASISEGVRIGDDVRIDPGAVFAPVAPVPDATPAVVNDGAVVGAGAVLYAGIVIGPKALVRPGAVVTRSVPAAAIVEGNPAAIVGYVDTERGPDRLMQSPATQAAAGVEVTAVDGVTLHTFPVIADLRGDLTVGEFQRQIPFTPLRYFMVFGVPNKEVRGEHAHRECHQFLICVRGSCAVVADDGRHRVEVVLDAPNRGLHLPPMTWGVQYKYSPDALLLVFASHHYDAADYVRNYDDFTALIARKP